MFLAVWLGAVKFKKKASVKTWIYRIAYKQSISWLRKHGRKSSPIELEEVIDSGDSPEDKALTEIRNVNIRRAMGKLTPKHRAVLELAFVQDMSYSDISEVLDCPVGTVKSRMSYALRYLNRILLKTGIENWDDLGKEM